MSALDDLKAAVAANDVGIQHVKDLLTEASTKLSAPSDLSDEDIEDVAKHLQEGADTLSGMTLLAPQTSGVPGATTANQAPPDASPATPPTSAPSAS